MTRVTATALYMVLLAWPVLFVNPQAVSTPAAQFRGTTAGAVMHASKPTQLASSITRQEIECILSGVCPAGDGAGINS